MDKHYYVLCYECGLLSVVSGSKSLRYSDGDVPAYFLKHLQKDVKLLKPVWNAISVIDKSAASNDCAT